MLEQIRKHRERGGVERDEERWREGKREEGRERDRERNEERDSEKKREKEAKWTIHCSIPLPNSELEL